MRRARQRHRAGQRHPDPEAEEQGAPPLAARRRNALRRVRVNSKSTCSSMVGYLAMIRSSPWP
jgi:hypothetical protein